MGEACGMARLIWENEDQMPVDFIPLRQEAEKPGKA
jgi:hypothetical protein